jgi:hypothetical protein
MQDLIKRKIIEWSVWLGFVIVFIIVIPLAYLTAPKKGDVVVINCGISEISPDFTTEMREACRQLRANNNLQKPK